ncbi:MAG TPA: chemotaxis protein CheB [Gemmatimonadaceae bacterium]|nr:chemotaxis protein CheB [Gemmatimonadaceae bacterium]
MKRYTIAVLGMSWGGLHALRTIAAALPADFPVPLLAVQHRHKDSDSALRELVQDRCALTVCEVEDKQPINPGFLYIAPPDYHTLVEGKHFSLSTDAPVRFSRPSIDISFESVAEACGGTGIGVVLTGANDDGAGGLRRIVSRGGRGIVQDPATAEVATMPLAALRLVPEAEVVPLDEIGPYLVRVVTGATAARRPPRTYLPGPPPRPELPGGRA